MSYILEALKKADAERERGAVPDLHSQAVPLAATYAEPPPAAGRPWLWLAVGSAIVVAAALAWHFGATEPPLPPVPPTPAAAMPAAPAPPASPAPPATLSVPRVVTDPAPPPAVAPAPAPAAAPPPPPPPPVRVPARTRPELRPPPAASAPAAARDAEAASAPRAPEKVPSLNELPDEIRRQVPPMTIGGSVYAPQPANRMVIVNGQVLREGTTVAPGLVLERIAPKSAVFSIHGQRFEVPF